MRYYKAEKKNGVTYSCDMLRLTFKTPYQIRDDNGSDLFVHIDMDRLTEIMQLNDYEVNYYKTNKYNAYRHMFTFRKQSFVVVIGLEHNVMRDRVYNNFIEFNPNKADMYAIKFIFRYLTTWIKLNPVTHTFFEISRYDIACDVPASRDLVKIMSKGRRMYKYEIGHDGSVTEYLGKRNTNGFVKVYDKTKESKLDYDLTRIEITVEGMDIRFPDIRLKQYQETMILDKLDRTDRVLIELLKRCDEEEEYYWFKQLGRVKGNKLKPYLFLPKESFEFDRNAILEVQQVVKNIANNIFDINEGSGFVDTFVKWYDKCHKQCFTPTAKSSTIWKKIDETYARALFGE